MAKTLDTTRIFPFEGTLSLAGTADGFTFDATVDFVEIAYADLDCFIAKTEAALASAADGSKEGRVFVRAGTIGRIIPWGANELYFVNETLAETPTIYGVGMV